jgi:hypothetical protein
VFTEFFRAWQDANGKLPDHFLPVQPQGFRHFSHIMCGSPQETFDLTVQVDGCRISRRAALLA